MMKKLLLLLLVSGCGTALYIPTESNVTADVSLNQLQEGRKLYIENCSSCHVLYHPNRFKKDEWVKQVDEMAERSHINANQKELILKYLCNAPVAAN